MVNNYLAAIVAYLVLIGFIQTADADMGIKVTVEGVSGAILNNILSYLSIEQQKDRLNLSEGFVKRMHQRAIDEIRSALQPFGYYKPNIQADLTWEDTVGHARYKIDIGKPVVISKIELLITGIGADDEGFKNLVANPPIKEGEVFEHASYEKTKRILQELATKFGYFDAQMVTHQIKVFPQNDEAMIILHFDTGPRYRFGKVIFYQDTFREEFLTRFVPFKQGDLYTLSGIFELQNLLTNSDYFSQVEVQGRHDKAEGLEVPVEVTLIPLKRHKYTFGIGYGTDTGIRGSLGWENRRINSWGHRMNAELRLSEIKNSFTSRYIVPLRNPCTDHFDYTAGWIREDTKISDSETFLGGISHNHSRRQWMETFYINYQYERFNVGSESGYSDLLIPGVSWIHIKADDRIYTTHGNRLLLELRGAHKALLSDLSFIQIRMQSKFIYGLRGFGRLILRGEGGAGLVDNFSEMPVSLRFFAGGDQSVRGYGYKTLGPTDEGGKVIGGRHLLIMSIEYEQRLTERWGVALFYDIGNAINTPSDPLKEGAGLGIRWRSPVGSIRVDIASPLDTLDTPDPLWRLHLSIGPDL